MLLKVVWPVSKLITRVPGNFRLPLKEDTRDLLRSVRLVPTPDIDRNPREQAWGMHFVAFGPRRPIIYCLFDCSAGSTLFAELAFGLRFARRNSMNARNEARFCRLLG